MEQIRPLYGHVLVEVRLVRLQLDVAGIGACRPSFLWGALNIITRRRGSSTVGATLYYLKNYRPK
jgi:hypothetical protein